MPALNPRFMRFPFAESGDKSSIPDTIQPSGDVSYEEGWTPDYELEIGVDPNAKAIDRQKHNSVFDDATLNIRQYQLFGFPEWVDPAQNGGVPVEYDLGATVRYAVDLKTYRSLVDNNVDLPTNALTWVEVTGENDWIPIGGDRVLAGTEEEFLNIPAGVEKIELVVRDLSTTGNNDDPTIQLGGVSYVVAGYDGQVRSDGQGSTLWTTEAVLAHQISDAFLLSYFVEMVKFTDDIWMIKSTGLRNNAAGNNAQIALGYVDVGETLQKFKIMAQNGESFDSGVALARYFGTL